MTHRSSATSEHRFNMADQLRFAELTGDTNPMHIDALAARRTQAGAPVVHGVHAVLWALDRLAGEIDLSGLAGITVSLNRFIYLDRPVTVRITRQTAASITADVVADGVTVITLLLKLGPRGSAGTQDEFHGFTAADLTCTAETPEELKDVRGWLEPAGGDLAREFPELSRAIGSERIVGLGLLSTLVGMACPGLHSIFTAFQAEILDATPDREGIGFYVRVADPRFRIVRMMVGGSGLRATVSSFVRMPPMTLPPMAELQGLVAADEFAGQRVLIVGGSRGLGAMSARLVAAGGGEVVLTYARGEVDANAVAADIHAYRGDAACSVAQMDVTRELAPQLAALSGAPFTGLLYFATPQIRRQKPSVFVPEVHADFFRYYVLAFVSLTYLLLAATAEAKLAVFWPSSVAVVERPEDMTEYAMAKAAGEVLVADLAMANSRLRLVMDRLGRLPTDQNATVVQAEFADPVSTMLPLLRKTLRG